jgi:hypothetical protein
MTDAWLRNPKEPVLVLRDNLRRAIEGNAKRHARRKKYPPYWLAIYGTSASKPTR